MRRWGAIATLVVASSVAQALSPAAGQADGLPHAGGSEVRLSVPRATCLVSPTGQLHPLFGVPGGYVLGEPVRFGVLSVVCGEGFALVKTAETLEWFDADTQPVRRWPVPGGPAVFGVGADGARAVVYLPGSGQWFLAEDGDLRLLRVALGGQDEEVLSVALLGRDSIGLASRRSGRLWFSRVRLDGFPEEARELAEAVAPILVLPDGAIAWGAGEGFVLQQQAGARRYVPLPAPPAELAAAGERDIYVQLGDGQGRLLVRLSEDRADLYRLPEAPQ